MIYLSWVNQCLAIEPHLVCCAVGAITKISRRGGGEEVEEEDGVEEEEEGDAVRRA